MKLVVHRGTHEIGGSCVEVESQGQRLVLDLGMPLVNPDGSPFNFREGGRSAQQLMERRILPPVSGLYVDEAPSVAGVVISHAHQDHSGFLSYVRPDVPVYASEGTRALLGVSSIFMWGQQRVPGVTILPKGEALEIGPFKLTALLVDHSAPDALALLVEAEGKKLFYSGDLRAHGRKGVLFERMLKAPPQGVDVLLLEGTLMGQRHGRSCSSEREVEKILIDVFADKSNVALVFCSSQNIDRLVSVFRAAKRTSCTFIMDLYTAYVLRALRCVSDRLPQFDWSGVRVFFWKRHEELLREAGEEEFLSAARSRRIGPKGLASLRKKAVFLARANRFFHKALKSLESLEGVEVIWSMWPGYLTGDDPVSSFCKGQGLEIRYVHTSGHAGVEDLKRLAEAIRPGRLVPIHTSEPERFKVEFGNVLLAEDGKAIHL